MQGWTAYPRMSCLGNCLRRAIILDEVMLRRNGEILAGVALPDIFVLRDGGEPQCLEYMDFRRRLGR